MRHLPGRAGRGRGAPTLLRVGLHAQSSQLGARRGARRLGGGGGQPLADSLLPGYPGGLRTGLGTGSERFLRPCDTRGSAHWRRGSGVLEGECGAHGSGSAGKSEPGQEAGGCGRVPGRHSRPCGPGALSLVRDRVRELSEASPREVFGSAPLEGVAVDHFLPQRRSGRWPRSPSTDSEMAPAEVAGAGRWGRGVGAPGLRPVEPRRDNVGFWSLRGLLVVVEGGCERP